MRPPRRPKALASPLALLGLAPLVCLACEPMELPGQAVGTYSVAGDLMGNTCGTQALPAEPMLQFQVDLRDNAGVGLWLVDGQLPGFQGDLNADGSFLFSRSTTYTSIEASDGSDNPAPETVADFLLGAQSAPSGPGCALSIVETVEGTLSLPPRETAASAAPDAGTDPALLGAGGLTATSTIEVVPVAGSQCRPALLIEGGPFRELPCVANYRLDGQRVMP